MATVHNANYAESFVTNYTRSLGFTGTTGRDITVVIGRGNAVAAPSGVTDNSSGTPAYTLIDTKTVGGNTYYTYKRDAITGSPTSLTISSTADDFFFTWVFESDALGAIDIDGATTSASGAYTNSHTTASFSPSVTDGLILLFVAALFGSSNTFGAPTNYTAVRSGSIQTDIFYRGTHSSGSQTATWTTDNSPECSYFILSFAPGSGGPSGSLIRRDRRMGGGMGPILSGGMSG